MASKRRDKLVLGLFEDRDALQEILARLQSHSASRNNTFVFANERQQDAIDDLLAAPLDFGLGDFKLASSKERVHQRDRLSPLSARYLSRAKAIRQGKSQPAKYPRVFAQYDIDLPENRIVVGLNSPRATELGGLFKELGAIEVHFGGVPRVIDSVGRSNELARALSDIVQQMVPARSYGRTVGIPTLASTALTGHIDIIDFSESDNYVEIEFDEDAPSMDLLPSAFPADVEEATPTPDIFQGIWIPATDLWASPAAASPEPTPVEKSVFVVRSDDDFPPPPPASPGPGEPDGPTERFIEGRFPSSVQVGKSFYLEVRIAVEPADGTKTTAVNPGVLPANQDAQVLFLLHAPDFTISGDQRARTIKVPAKKNSDFALWELTPNRVATLDLAVTAYYGSAALGELRIEVASLDSAGTGATTTKSTNAEFQKPDPGEITLEIRYDPGNRVYKCNFISTRMHTDDMALKPLNGPPEEVISPLIADLNALARGEIKIDPKQMPDWLRGKGLDLWLEFIPEGLQSLIWNERANIKRLTILSGGDPIPWELLYPTEPGGSPDPAVGFLGDTFGLTRWRFGKTPPTTLQNGRACFVLPPTAPKQAVAEVDALKSIAGNDSVVVGSLGQLSDVLQSADFGILHFACHNTFTKTSATIALSDGPLAPSTLRNYLNKFKQNPLIFMNACRTDGQIQSYNRLSGWATSFLDTGVGAFVGSLWEIRDTSARSFAATLYNEMKTKSLGDAVTSARKFINSGDGDPTWLAYSVYGSPDAKITQ